MIVLGLGSNLGDRAENIRRAVALLSEQKEIAVEKVASLYETEPVGYVDQAPFLNTVVEIKTTLSPRELLERCLQVELQMGRVREVRWGPRNIDIDLLIYNDVVWEDAELILPHPRLQDRRFVLVPLQELAADEIVCQGARAAELLARTPDTSQVVKYGPLAG
ncbi:MAG TPA: 2-amino-4-hydroxy-6-hydroxymethyldihydropteridine diphosphokinase [Patescibacteria group bacterium]|nr:2-amino-4-hydroxy-6-hydroxymethyldihydropteridine diphosphokinase [Patescibacteria group bacterium]